MGFYEFDRIRSKNKAYNFPTPDINFRARALLKELKANKDSQTILSELQRMLDINDDAHTREVLTTAITIVKHNY